MTDMPEAIGMKGPREIEHDPHDPTREYIPLPGGWEVQTKGAGSSYRLLDKKTGERHAIISGADWRGVQEFFTRFAHEVFAASCDEQKQAANVLQSLTEERDRLREALEEAIEFADQDAQALTPAGVALVGRWRRALTGDTHD